MWDYIVKKVRTPRPTPESGDIHAATPPMRDQAGHAVRGDETSFTPSEAAARARQAAGGAKEQSGAARSKHPGRKLDCPVCRIPMDLKYIGQVEIDQCPRCQGIFLDKGELKQIKGRDFSTYEHRGAEHEHLVYTPHGLSDHVRNRD